MIMIVGFSEILLYSAICTRTQLALIKECLVLSVLSPWMVVAKPQLAVVISQCRFSLYFLCEELAHMYLRIVVRC